jgi:hypothetical protein
MHPRARRTEGSAVEQLLASIGVHRHADPFAHLAGRENDASDWVRMRIMDCSRRGACPLCAALESSLSDYLYWLPINLRDADYFLYLHRQGGFCPDHLDPVMTSLHKFPYGQVRLFALLKMLLEEGRMATSRSCHLCRTLEQTRQVYMAAAGDLLSPAGGAREARALASCLCPQHAASLEAGPKAAAGERESRRRQGAFQDLGRHRKAAVFAALDEITREFHNMGPDELRKKLDACEALLRRAMAPGGMGHGDGAPGSGGPRGRA